MRSPCVTSLLLVCGLFVCVGTIALFALGIALPVEAWLVDTEPFHSWSSTQVLAPFIALACLVAVCGVSCVAWNLWTRWRRRVSSTPFLVQREFSRADCGISGISEISGTCETCGMSHVVASASEPVSELDPHF